MPRRSLSILFIVLCAAFTLAICLGAALLAGCGEQASVDPKTVLAASSARMKQIKGFHFEYEVHLPEGVKPGSGLFIARIIGDVNAEGNMRATVDATWGGVPVSLGFVALGDTHYIQDPISKQWQTVPAAQSPVGTLSLSAGTIRILDRIADATYKGQENKGGTTTYHIKGTVAAEEVEAIAGAVETTKPFPTDLWIGANDSLVYEVRIYGPATPREPEKIWRSIVLSNLDVYVEIEAPK